MTSGPGTDAVKQDRGRDRKPVEETEEERSWAARKYNKQ
jgi:hypothetical protein